MLARYLLTTGMPRYENYPDEIKQKITALPMGRSMVLNDSFTWDDLSELRKRWPRRLMVKGVLTAEEAKLAADCGVDAVIVRTTAGACRRHARADRDAAASGRRGRHVSGASSTAASGAGATS